MTGKALEAYLKDNNLHFAGAMCACICCVATYGICFCPCLYCYYKASSITQGLQDIAASRTKQWPAPARVELAQSASHVAHVMDEQGIDQFGAPAMSNGKHGPRPVWPPLGLNVIITIPGEKEQFRQLWMRGAGAGAMMQAPQQIPMAQAIVVPATVVGSGQPQQGVVNEVGEA
ncbi:unnamed protein product [Effrenium voratum]|nr:unnamed protein product [Effrenium voratum]